MQTGCKENHLQEENRMDLSNPMTEPGGSSCCKNTIVGEESFHPKS
jgi:hypothetical protein